MGTNINLGENFRMRVSQLSSRLFFRTTKSETKMSNLSLVGCMVLGVVPYGLVMEFLHVQKSKGVSMEPTIRDGSYIICLNTIGHLSGIQYLETNKMVKLGSIVIAENPEEQSGLIVKRVTKIGGQNLFWRKIMDSIVIPENHVWLEGDNWTSSVDSRQFGYISIENIKPRYYLFSVPKIFQ